MSKSIGNCIYLSDEVEEIKRKVNSIKTFPRKIEEPGIVKDNVLFIYLRAFSEDKDFKKHYPEYKNLKELEKAYSAGGIGDGRIKQFLLNILIDVLTPIREKRKELQKNIPEVLKILREGTNKANKVANETLREMKQSMGINYYGDNTFETEQIIRYSN